MTFILLLFIVALIITAVLQDQKLDKLTAEQKRSIIAHKEFVAKTDATENMFINKKNRLEDEIAATQMRLKQTQDRLELIGETARDADLILEGRIDKLDAKIKEVLSAAKDCDMILAEKGDKTDMVLSLVMEALGLEYVAEQTLPEQVLKTKVRRRVRSS